MAKEIKNAKKKLDFNKNSQKSPTNKNFKTQSKINSNQAIKSEIICIMIICFSLILIISVFFNGGGALGNLLSSSLKGIFGVGAYILPIVAIFLSVFIFFAKEKKINIFKFVLSLVCFFTIITFFYIISKDKNAIIPSYFDYFLNQFKTGGFFNGGLLGAVFGEGLLKIMGTVSSYIFLIVIFIASIILLSGKSFFILVKNKISNLPSYFSYDYPIKEEYQENYENNTNKKSIFSKIKDKFFYKQDNFYEEQFYEDNYIKNQEQFEQEEFLEEQAKNKRILKKQKDFIYDGMDKYIKIEVPTFFKIIDNKEKTKEDEKIVLAINEINKIKEIKNKELEQNKLKRNEIPNVLKKSNVLKRNNEIKYYNSSIYNKPKENKQHTYSQNLQITEQQNKEYKNLIPNLEQAQKENDYQDNFKNDYENENIEENNYNYNEEIEHTKEDDLKGNKKLKREDFYKFNLSETIYELDFDIPSRKEIEELFSIPPEYALSENTDFKQLDKIDLFYNFNEDMNISDINEYEEQEASENLFNVNYRNEQLENIENEYEEQEASENLFNVNYRNEQLKNIESEYREQEPNQNSNNINYNNIQMQNAKVENEKQEFNQNLSNLNYNSHNNISSNAKIKFNTPIQNYDKDNDFEQYDDFENEEQKEPTIIRAEKEKILTESLVKEKKEYVFPSFSFLNKNLNAPNEENDLELKENSNILIKTLNSFNIPAEVINISKGPSVTRYEISIEAGIKVSKILGLADNLALSLAATSIRIEAPIPGKSAVGIEVPNKEINNVFLSEVICSEKFQKASSKVSFGIGKDITGNVIVTDIAKMPHMLIAGATGSGKSVCINTLITSILYKATPDEVKLMMIDPKVVELSVYNGIPHLLTPVVTEPEKAAGVLNWAVSEMLERYNLFAQTKTRSLTGYNQLKAENNEPTLPQIVIIIDELADLMMVAAKEVEASICRLAQLARAAGIHLIIATQRPSVDVITGLIKSNIPSRIAFAVSSGTDSRTVIDSVGAEKLLGKGDMLFKAVDMNKPLRIQGAFISDKEVEKIVTFIKENNEVNYDKNIINKIENSVKKDDGYANNSESDELTEEVISFLVRKGKASTSMIQRQFRIGYNRAARIIEELEERGIIGSENGSKQREVLMDKYQYEEYLNRYESY